MELFLSSTITVFLTWFAYRRLVTGTSETVTSRLRIIVVNFRHIFAQLAWLVVMGILNCLSYTDENNDLWPKACAFVFPARGFFDLMCWFWIHCDNPTAPSERPGRWRLSRLSQEQRFSRSSQGRNGRGNGMREAFQRVRSNTIRALDRNRNRSETVETASMNTVLQNEMTSYVQRGLQQSAKAVNFEDMDDANRHGYRIISLRDASDNPELVTLRVTDFFRLVFGMNCAACCLCCCHHFYSGGSSGSGRSTSSSSCSSSSSSSCIFV